ncbi:unnamed protein product [Rotaria sp. Silwood2]|nr:unnamed protein product [Rotaria sp. Silwood2]
MGCSCSRVAPVIEPVPDAILKPTNQNDSAEKEERKKHKRPLSNDHTQDDYDNKRLVISPINTRETPIIDRLQSDHEYVEIEVSDPQAFNDAFIQQRQKVINNQSYRVTIQSWRPNSLAQLVSAIKSLSENKSLIDCHWIIFYWIACNIEYDVVSYFSKNYADQSAEGVFRTKKGVCAGYANIYKYLCDQLNISCEKVSGYSKGYGFDEREGAPSETDHAWNAVEIDHHWYLMESTWGAGHLTEQKAFQHELNSYYFFPRPNEMIYHHLPENEKWQLLREPIKMEQYVQLPKIHPIYFQLNLNLISPRHQVNVDLLPGKPYALVLMRAPSDVHLIADLKLHNQKIEGGHRLEFDNNKQVYCCYFAPNSIGKHKITIYAKQGDTQEGTYSGALDLTLNVNEIPKNPISFPEIWKKFFDLNLNIISPKNTHLIKVHNGQTHAEILIQTPNDVELLGRLVDIHGEKIEGGNQVFYDRDKNLWQCKFAPNHDGMFNAEIMAKKKSDTGLYTSAISFKIDAKNISTPSISFPEIWKKFFDLNLNIISPKNTHLIKVHNGQTHAEILIQTPNDVELLGRLVDIHGEKIEGGNQVFYDRDKNLWQCKFAPNHDGMFNAEIMAKKKSDTALYTSAVSFKVDARNIPTPPLSYPVTWPLFYELDLKIEAPRNRATAIWPENASYTEIRMSAPNNLELSCDIIFNGSKNENCALTQFDNDKQQWHLLFAPQHTGLHKLTIYARRQSDSQTSFNAVAEFDLNVTKLRKTIKFPLTYTKFQTNKCRIYEPLHGTLKRDAILPIHCVIPGADDVDLQVDSQWMKAKGYEDPVLRTEIKVGSKDVTIYAKYKQNTSYDGLVRYSVE